MIDDYLGIDLKQSGVFAGAMLFTAIIVTALYWFVYGFDHWNDEMHQASNLMMAANIMPLNTQHVPLQNNSAGQYLCPLHGAVGLPVFDQMGQPHCPVCNSTMQFTGASALYNRQQGIQQAAWNTGGGGG